MKENLIKVKKFVEKHDEIFVTILIFIMSLGYSLYIKTLDGDELWNFQNVYKIYNGYKIYVDANVITTPIFHCIGVLFFKTFGANFLVFRLYNIIICIALFLGVYKLFKSLKIGKKKSFVFLLIVYLLENGIIGFMANYNTLAMVFVLFAMIVIINKEKIKRYELWEAILITLIILTKQNIGIFYLIGLILYTILNKRELKNTIKILGITGMFLLIFIVILYFNNILEGFISYTILGIKEFDRENRYVGKFSIYFIIIAFINSLLILFINTRNKYGKKEEKSILNNITCFAYPILGITYPIFNIAHIRYTLILQYVLLFYMLNLILKECKVKKYEIKNCIINILIILIILIIGYYTISSIMYAKSYFKTILNNKYKYSDPYFGTLFSNEIEEKIDKVTEYIQKSEKNVIYITSDAALYMIPLKQNNKVFDLLLLGNLGRDGENGIIDKLNRLDNTTILMNKEKQCWQESDKIIDFVKNNYKNVGEIEDILIYQYKN